MNNAILKEYWQAIIKNNKEPCVTAKINYSICFESRQSFIVFIKFTLYTDLIVVYFKMNRP